MKPRLRAPLVAGAIPGGGTCIGDAGGPAFLDGDVVVDTSYGYTNNCRYIDGTRAWTSRASRSGSRRFPGLEYLD